MLITQDVRRWTRQYRLRDAALAGLGHIGILVDCAGGSRPLPLDASEESWEERPRSTLPGSVSFRMRRFRRDPAPLAPHHPHYRQIGTRSPECRVFRQGWGSRLGQRHVTRCRQVRNHLRLRLRTHKKELVSQPRTTLSAIVARREVQDNSGDTARRQHTRGNFLRLRFWQGFPGPRDFAG